MAAVVPLTAFEAIQNKIKTLCLKEFPCGTGSWREIDDLQRAIKKGQLKHRSHEKISDFSQHEAQKEKTENLLDLITSPPSPWYLDCDWSNEAEGLRQTAIKSPWIINPDNVYSYFRTLRIVDKSVTDVDDGLLRLKNLEELTLTANYITSINSRCLPPSLKVLELCANNISDISDLCNTPPPLHHLGLGRNNISLVGNYISGHYWPNLVSLDLSYNDLSDLIGLVSILRTLPKLRNLILQGNPVSLVPAYRGYIIDSLKSLYSLDKRLISADEKFQSQGFATKKKIILDEAVVQIGVPFLKGLQCPAEIMYPDEGPDFPVIKRTYFVQFKFPEKLFGAAEEREHQIVDTLTDEPPAQTPSVVAPLTAEEEDLLNKLNATVTSHQSIKGHEQISLEKNLASDGAPPKENGIKTSESKDVKREEAEVPPQMNMMPVSTPFYPWEEEIHVNWTTDLIMKDLLVLRDFFKTGMDVNVMEQIIECYPIEPETKAEKSETKGKDKKKEKADPNPESFPEGRDKKRDKDQGKSKKRKLLDEELVSSPPYFNNIASFHASLDCFLDGEYSYEETFTVFLSKSLEDRKDKKTSFKHSQEKKKGTDAGRSSKDKEAEKRSSKGKRYTVGLEEDEEITPLALKVTLELQH